MGKVIDKAEELFTQDKYNCAEASLSALCGEWGLSSGCIPRIATGFGGGVGMQGCMCGALSGAVMAIGLRYGSSDARNKKQRSLVMTKTSQLMERFGETFGEVDCRELIGCDLSTPEGMKKARKEQVRTEKCRHFVRRSVELAVDICG